MRPRVEHIVRHLRNGMIGGEQHIRHGQVAVHNSRPVLVQKRQPPRNVADPAARRCNPRAPHPAEKRELSGPPALMLAAHEALEALCHELREDKQHAAVGGEAPPHERAQVRVVDLVRQPQALEHVLQVLIVRVLERNDLDHRLLRVDLRLVHDAAHPPPHHHLGASVHRNLCPRVPRLLGGAGDVVVHAVVHLHRGRVWLLLLVVV
mmetsp:Transcript_42934/g.83964  ORF Transcript_42934/g.83964 Transcript_42934/m.83964 type:complete len:207 (-) Transcript_42934:81-701(-)